MLHSFIVFKLLEKCLESFFDTVITNLTPLDKVLSEGDFIKALKVVIRNIGIGTNKILVGDNEPMIYLAAILLAGNLNLNEYIPQLRLRIFQFLTERMEHYGEFAGIKLEKAPIWEIKMAATSDNFFISVKNGGLVSFPVTYSGYSENSPKSITG
jgi:hypothetical protein